MNKKGVEILENVNLKKYNTYRLDVYAKYLAFPEDSESLIDLINYLKNNNIKYKILGCGSNLIFKNNYEGCLIKLDKFNKLEINKNKVKVGAGYSIIKLSLTLSKLGLSGLEFASGIPGSIGGCIYNNAGAYNSSMENIVESIRVIDKNLEIKTLYNKDIEFEYRSSKLKKTNEYICIEANIKLSYKDKVEILKLIEDRKQRRLLTQPLEYPSAGSVFRNPENNTSWKLIEGIGYKGKILGGAKVSEKHANFIINNGNAKGTDIINLIDNIKKKVKEKYNIDLILEQEIIE